MQLKKLLKIDIANTNFSDAEAVRILIQHLSNLIEGLYKENLELKEVNQKLKDEIARLKGEQGKPNIKPSSTEEKKEFDKKLKDKKEWEKDSKLDKIKIDEEKIIKYEGKLPADAQFKGYRSLIVQDIIIKTNNIEYRLEQYYSPSEGKSYTASLSDYISGEFGAYLKSWIITWYFNFRMSEDKIHQLLTDIGISISKGQISNIIIKNNDEFHKEKSDILEAGIKSTPYQHIDDTGARVCGDNQYFNVLCNEYYSAFFITPKKNRLTIIDILNAGHKISYLINSYALAFLKERNLKLSILESLRALLNKSAMPKEKFVDTLRQLIQDLNVRQETMILAAAAIAGYQEGYSAPVIQRLVCDDAKQFYDITKRRALCWIHEDRHYEKLTPLFPLHQELINNFRSRIWKYYYKLTKYKKKPNQKDKIRLSVLFDEIFSTITGYDELDKCIKHTKEKKDNLLVVLDYPDTPLNNNPAELALRMYVIKRKISFGTKTSDGTRSWETFFTIMDTARKLGVNFREYLCDRISKLYNMPSLASLIPVPLEVILAGNV